MDKSNKVYEVKLKVGDDRVAGRTSSYFDNKLIQLKKKEKYEEESVEHLLLKARSA